MTSLKKNMLIGTVWSLTGQFGTMAISLVSNIILARLLTPFEFGQVGIVMFFITLATVFTESGFGGALVRKKDVTDEDYSTIFIFNLLVSSFCFLLIVCFSGVIADFYKVTALKLLLIGAGSILFVNALNITQNARLIRDMQFKKLSLFKFVSVLLASVIGIFMAFKGFGVWALIVIQLLTAAFYSFLLMVSGGMSFSTKFNRASFREMYRFGLNTTLASLLNTTFENIYSLVLGKFFSISQVGIFYQAKKLQDVPSNVINLTTQSVIFSSLSKLQDDKAHFINTYNRIILIFTVLMGSLTSFIFLYSKQIIVLLYGAKWLGADFFIRLLCIASFFYLQEMFNRLIFKVFDQTRQILYLEIVKKTIQAISICIGIMFMNIEVLIWGFVFTSIISYFINFYFTRKVLGKVTWHELLVLFKVVFSSVVCVFLTISLISYFHINGYLVFALFPFFALSYFLCLRVLKINLLPDFRMMLSLLRN